MRYFRLATDCFLVEGDHDAAIYDTQGRRLYLLDARAHELVRQCEDNVPLEDATPLSIDLLRVLQQKGVGFFDSQPAFVDKFLLHQPVEWMGMALQPPAFNRVDWSITNRCELGCSFCGQGDEVIGWLSCLTCTRRQKTLAHPWRPQEPAQFVGQIASLGARLLHLRGGNPLLEWDMVQEIAGAIDSTSLELVITTPGTGQQIVKVAALSHRDRVRLNLVMFGTDEATTRAACARPGIFEQQQALIEHLLQEQAHFSVTFVLTASTHRRRQEIERFFRQQWGLPVSFAEVHFRQTLATGIRLSHVDEHSKPLVEWRSVDEFHFRVRHNSCLFGNLEIGADGAIRSCAGMGRVHGSVSENGLRSALAGDTLYRLWNLDKGQIEPCSHCALRYTCTDCAAFEISGQDDASIKRAYCPRDPTRDAPRPSEKYWPNSGFVYVVRLPCPDT